MATFASRTNLTVSFEKTHRRSPDIHLTSFSTACERFNLGPDLLEHLYVAPLDIAVSESDLGHVIKSEDERVRQKYRPLFARYDIHDPHGGRLLRTARQAYDERWPIAEIGVRLEQILLEHLHSSEVSL